MGDGVVFTLIWGRHDLMAWVGLDTGDLLEGKELEALRTRGACPWVSCFGKLDGNDRPQSLWLRRFL